MHKTHWKMAFTFLFLAVSVVWLAVIFSPGRRLHIVACVVGQGDAFLIFQGETQILVDGGPDGSMVDCLSRYLPFWDREIELVVLSHPQEDHFRGLIDVFRRYKVDYFLVSPLDSDSQGYGVLKKEVGGSDMEVVTPRRGGKIRLGKIYLDIVHPLGDYEGQEKPDTVLGSFVSSDDPNDYSIVFVLKYGNFDALFTGDIGPDVEDEIISLGEMIQAEYIKIPHHGSRNGLTEKFLESVNPQVAVISVGRNPWGHPHREVLDMLEEFGVAVYRTDLEGDIEIVTDGERFWRANP